MWLYNRSFHFITFIYLVDYKNTQGVTLPWPTVSGASPEKTQMTGMDLNAWGPESSGPSLHISATWAGMTRWPAVLWLWTRTPVCYSLSVTGILIAWGLGPERETFPRTWGTLMALNDLALKVMSITQTHSVGEKWNTSPLIPRGRIRLHLEEMAGSHYRTACRMGNTPAALYGKYILL